MSDRLGCALCGAETYASGAQLVCMACWQDHQAEIDRLRDKWRVADDLASERGQEIEQLRAERDEAREAARAFYQSHRNMGLGGDVWVDYPWLLEEVGDE